MCSRTGKKESNRQLQVVSGEGFRVQFGTVDQDGQVLKGVVFSRFRVDALDGLQRRVDAALPDERRQDGQQVPNSIRLLHDLNEWSWAWSNSSEQVHYVDKQRWCQVNESHCFSERFRWALSNIRDVKK